MNAMSRSLPPTSPSGTSTPSSPSVSRARPLAVIDWSLHRSAERIKFYAQVGDDLSLAIERRVCDRLLDERLTHGRTTR